MSNKLKCENVFSLSHLISQSRGNNKGWSDKKLCEVCSSKSLEQVSVIQSELQLHSPLLVVNICKIKGNLTESKLGYVCVWEFAEMDWIKGFLGGRSLSDIFEVYLCTLD